MNFSFQSRQFGLAALAAIILAFIAKFTFTTLSTSLAPEWAAAIIALIAALITALIASYTHQSTEAVNNSRTLYVGNLPYRANEAAVRELFSEHGHVYSVRLMKDRQTGKRRGFGFVEMAANDAEMAIGALNESEFQERTLKVREAKDKANA